MRSQKEPMFDFAIWERVASKLDRPGRTFSKVNIQTRPGRHGGKEIGHPAFPGAGIVGRQEGRVDAGQGDQLAQQFFGIRHSSGDFRG